MRILKYFSIIAVILAIAFYIRSNTVQYQSYQGNIFGTVYHIKIRTDNEDPTLQDAIKAELASVNSQMSVFEEKSEISKINQAPKNKKIGLSSNMSYLLRHAERIYKESQGAFDPTIGPLIDNWGFGPNKKSKQPSAAQIKETLRHVGFNKLKLDKAYKTLSKTDAQTSLNLSAIAKGYGVDKVAELLESKGYEDYIIEIGGEVRAKGYRDEAKTPWSVGIAEPQQDGANSMIIELTDISVATSGDYNNFRTDNKGLRYSHTISPKTGYPVKNSLASVTVFDKLCTDADAYATAMMSMGFEKALEFADKYQISAIFFTHQNNDFVRHYSKSAKHLFGEDNGAN